MSKRRLGPMNSDGGGGLQLHSLFSAVDEVSCRTRIAPRQNSGRVKTKAPLTHQNHEALRLNSPPPSAAQFQGKNRGGGDRNSIPRKLQIDVATVVPG